MGLNNRFTRALFFWAMVSFMVVLVYSALQAIGVF